MRYNLSEKLIRDETSMPAIWNKGVQLLHQDLVHIISGLHSQHIELVVMDEHACEVNLYFTKLGDISEWSCSCDDTKKGRSFCPHGVAALLKVNQQGKTLARIDDELEPTWPDNDPTLKGDAQVVKSRHMPEERSELKLLHDLKIRGDQFLKKIIKLEVHLKFLQDKGPLIAAISFKVGMEKTYVVSDIRRFLMALKKDRRYHLGTNFTFDGLVHTFPDHEKPLMNYIVELYDEVEQLDYHAFDRKYFYLTELQLQEVFAISRDLTLYFNGHKGSLVYQPIPMEYHLQEEGGFLTISPQGIDELTVLGKKARWALVDDQVYMLPSSQQKALKEVVDLFEEHPMMSLSGEHYQYFADYLYPLLAKTGQVVMPKALEERIIRAPLEKRLYLDYLKGYLSIRVVFAYDKVLFEPLADRVLHLEPEHFVIRDDQEEEVFLKIFQSGSYVRTKKEFRMLKDEDIYHFIKEVLPDLAKDVTVYATDRYRKKKVIPPKQLTHHVRLTDDGNFLDYHFEMEGVSKAELKGVLQAYQEKRKFYVLKDGSYLQLNPDEFQLADELMDTYGSKKAQVTMKLPKSAALYLENELSGLHDHQRHKEERFQDFVKAFSKEPKEVTLPGHLDGVLRPYQSKGVSWLNTLAHFGLGGVLADDMGLGKTLQVLAFLSANFEKGQQSLIIAPTSLLYNWGQEIEKFTPELSYAIIEGPKQDRKDLIDKSTVDLLITSYALIRRDYDLYEDKHFNSFVLDEAQHIKNEGSKGARAVKKISADHRFALTGTPMENHLGEFWSIFDFVLPGHLGSRSQFISNFEKPIVEGNAKEQKRKLQELVRPFLLRRLKKEVLEELPDRIETTIKVHMSKEQEKLYGATLLQLKGELEAPDGKHTMKILAGLMRLRQICAHPGAYLEDFDGEVGKLSALQELVEELISGNHRVLVFSQFTSVLKILREHIPYPSFYLDGNTPVADRMDMVNAFNEGEMDIFFISLKAGGTGLNLTGADTVIHFDPWWNPAVEDQASDRVYRIGQTKDVHVMKLVMKDTIEERIVRLQEKKKRLIDDVITTESMDLGQLSMDELKKIFFNELKKVE